MSELMLAGRRKNTVRVNAMAVALLIRDLQEGVYTVPELADRSGLSAQTVRLYLKALHKANAVYICDWDEDRKGSRTLRVYAIGDKKDVPKPQPQSAKDACKKYRQKKKMMAMLGVMAHVQG